MTVEYKSDDVNKETMFTFRFGSTKKTIQLSEQHLIHIPYLSVLIKHKDDFQCGLNENNEYVLHSRIRYNWFNAILKATRAGRISALFTELPEEANVLGMLQLYDFLCLDPLPIPLLKNQHLVQTKAKDFINDEGDIEYCKATTAEECDTAVQFMIALSKHEYNVEDAQTLETIFKLLMAILLRPDTFGVRLCHHAFTITKKYYISLFSPSRQHQLYKTQQSTQNYDRHSLSNHFPNVFYWKGSYLRMKENQNESISSWYNTKSNDDINSDIQLQKYSWVDWRSYYWSHDFFCILHPCRYSHIYLLPYSEYEESKLWFALRSTISKSDLYSLRSSIRKRAMLIRVHPQDIDMHIYQIIEEKKKLEAQSARSGRFNTLCQRFTVDKFKHPYRTKTQKYR